MISLHAALTKRSIISLVALLCFLSNTILPGFVMAGSLNYSHNTNTLPPESIFNTGSDETKIITEEVKPDTKIWPCGKLYDPKADVKVYYMVYGTDNAGSVIIAAGPNRVSSKKSSLLARVRLNRQDIDGWTYEYPDWAPRAERNRQGDTVLKPGGILYKGTLMPRMNEDVLYDPDTFLDFDEKVEIVKVKGILITIRYGDGRKDEDRQQSEFHDWLYVPPQTSATQKPRDIAEELGWVIATGASPIRDDQDKTASEHRQNPRAGRLVEMWLGMWLEKLNEEHNIAGVDDIDIIKKALGEELKHLVLDNGPKITVCPNLVKKLDEAGPCVYQVPCYIRINDKRIEFPVVIFSTRTEDGHFPARYIPNGVGSQSARAALELAKPAAQEATGTNTAPHSSASATGISTVNAAQLLAEAIAALPKEWENGIVPADIVRAFKSVEELMNELSTNMANMTDQSVLVFSHDATFKNGLGILLPKLAWAGMKIAVIVNNDDERALIERLNHTTPDGSNKIEWGKDFAAIKKKFISKGLTTPNYYYFKVRSDTHILGEDLGGISVCDITNVVQKIIEALGEIHNISVGTDAAADIQMAISKFVDAAA